MGFIEVDMLAFISSQWSGKMTGQLLWSLSGDAPGQKGPGPKGVSSLYG